MGDSHGISAGYLSSNQTRGPVDMMFSSSPDAVITTLRRRIGESPPGQALPLNDFKTLGDLLQQRYAITKNEDDMQESIDMNMRVLTAIGRNHPLFFSILFETGRKWRALYEGSQNTEHLVKAISLSVEVIDTSPNGLTKPNPLFELSDHYLVMFQRENDIHHLNNAIKRGEQTLVALEIYPHLRASRERAHFEFVIAQMMLERYTITKYTDDLERAIELLESVVAHGDPIGFDISEIFSKLSYALMQRYTRGYKRDMSVDDLDEAIRRAKQGIESSSDDCPQLPGRLLSLAHMLKLQFERSGDNQYIVDAMMWTRGGLTLDHPDQALILDALALQYISIYHQTKDPEYLRNAVQNEEAAVELRHQNSITHTYNLCNMLAEKYKLEGDEHDITRAMNLAVDVLLSSDSEDAGDGVNVGQAHTLSTLASLNFFKFMKSCDESDLDSAITLAREAWASMQSNSSIGANIQHNLSNYLKEKFCITGNLDDIQAAMDASMTSENLMEDGHMNRALVLSGLAGMFEERYRRNRSLGDLRDAIKYYKKASEIVTDRHASKVVYLCYWSRCLGQLYERTISEQDLRSSVDRAWEALALLRPYDPIQSAFCFLTLSDRLGILYAVTGNPETLKKAIDVVIQAEKLPGLHGANRSAVLNALGSRYSQSPKPADKDLGIDYAKQAVEACPKNQSGRGVMLYNLGLHLWNKAKRSSQPEDLDHAVRCLEEAFHTTNSPPVLRLKSAKLASEILQSDEQWDRLSDLTSEAVMLLPLVSPKSLSQADQQDALKMLSGFASLAAAVALETGKKPSQALKLLELGRGIINGHRFELRTEVTDLWEVDPVLAKEFEQLREELDTPIDDPIISLTTTYASDYMSLSSRRQIANQKMEHLIVKIRQLKGLTRFLSPPRAKVLKAAALSGAIVIVNVSYRCDAIFVSKDSITALSLPKLKLENVISRAANPPTETNGIINQLAWLWISVARPVLDLMKIAVDSNGPSADWPRVWWVLTGPMCCFPIHAAGQKRGKVWNTMLNRVVSSYIPSIKALIYTRGNKNRPPAPDKVILSWMDTTEGDTNLQDLFNVRDEVERIAALIPSGTEPTMLERPSRRDVLSHLVYRPDTAGCKIFHFCGHGFSVHSDPSKNYLQLSDGALTVQDLIAVKMHKNPPTLAYLSACWSGKTTEVHDESIHLVGAFQLSGFRHVIGSLWTLVDGFAGTVAEEVYRRMLEEQMNEDHVALCLHDTIRRLREESETPLDPFEWAAFVHVGV